MLAGVPRFSVLVLLAGLTPALSAAPSAWRKIAAPDTERALPVRAIPASQEVAEGRDFSLLDPSLVGLETVDVRSLGLSQEDTLAPSPLVPLPPAVWSAAILGAVVAGRRVVRRFTSP